jgi:uncharacterized pyridoxal phosphate-containing UPF0001 family protein
MVKGYIIIIMEINIKVVGLMIENKVRELYKWKLVIHILGSGKIVRNMGRDCINLVMMIFIKGSLFKE